MERQPTVLLVRGAEMPTSLAELLRTRGVHVEEAGAGALGAVLTAFQLDLICLGLPLESPDNAPLLLAVRNALRVAELKVPLVALADWDVDSDVPARAHVAAVVPRELPELAIAHRVQTLAQRALNGEVLDKRISSVSRLRVPEASPVAQAKKAPRPRVDVPPRPAVARKTMESRKPPTLPPRPRRRTTPPPTSAEAQEIRRLCETFEHGDPNNRLSEWLTSARSSIPSRDTEPPASTSANPTVRPGSRVQEKPAELNAPIPDFLRPQLEEEQAEHASPRPHVGTSPSSIRVPLTSPGQALSGVRVAIVDSDVTRADALATTLRAHRVQVHLCSPRVEHFHARLLRKFSPHAIVIDEEALTTRAADFAAIVRRDPFLQHARLITVRLSRHFKAQTGATQLGTLLPLIQPLAQAEDSLLEKLGPTCEVELGFDEIPPHLLLKLLVPRSVSTQIECSHEEVSLTWTVGWNQAAPAELTQGGKTLELEAETALDWLLAHPDARVVIIQRPEREALVGENLIAIIDARLAREPKCEAPGTLYPGPTIRDDESDVNPTDRLRMAPEFDAEQGKAGTSAPSNAPQSTTRPLAISTRVMSSMSSPRRAGTFLTGAGVLAAAGALLFFGVWPGPTDERAAVLAQNAPPGLVVKPSIRAASPEASSASQAELEVANPSPFQKAQTPSAPSATVGSRRDRSLFLVEPLSEAPSCEQVLGSWKPKPKQPREAGRIYFRQAQKALVSGENGQAHYQLCQSALLMPGGPGSIELARYYLGLRAYSLADRHLQSALDSGDKTIELQLLHGDLLNQQGQEEVSLAIWLRAMQLEESDQAKRAAVSRKYVRDARSALKHMDYALAERYLRRAATLEPENVQSAALLAGLFKKLGHDEVAEAWTRQVEVLRHASDAKN